MAVRPEVVLRNVVIKRIDIPVTPRGLPVPGVADVEIIGELWQTLPGQLYQRRQDTDPVKRIAEEFSNRFEAGRASHSSTA